MVATVVVITMVAKVVAMEVVITAVAMPVEINAVAMAVAILNLIILTQKNLLVQKVGKTEVMEILLKTLNMRMAGAGEKGSFQ